jgi:serine/threonine-protein kinase
MGKAYWYNYGSSDTDVVGQVTLGTRWFDKVALLKDGSNSVQYNSAQIYVTIGSYYNELNLVDRAGESTASYSDYWQDLKKLYEQETDSQITKLYMMRSILYTIYSHADEFKAASISKDELNSLVEKINTDAPNVQIANNSRADTLKTDIARYATLALTKLNSTFS